MNEESGGTVPKGMVRMQSPRTMHITHACASLKLGTGHPQHTMHTWIRPPCSEPCLSFSLLLSHLQHNAKQASRAQQLKDMEPGKYKYLPSMYGSYNIELLCMVGSRDRYLLWGAHSLVCITQGQGGAREDHRKIEKTEKIETG